MKKDRIYSNYVLIIIVVCAFLSIGLLEVKAIDDEKIWKKDFEKFNLARNYIAENQPEQGEELLKLLLKKDEYKDSIPILWANGICLASLGKYNEAENYLLKVQEKRPMVVKDYIYLLQMGELYFQMGKYKEAIKYFELTKHVDNDGSFNEYIKSQLEKIKNNLEYGMLTK